MKSYTITIEELSFNQWGVGVRSRWTEVIEARCPTEAGKIANRMFKAGPHNLVNVSMV